MGFMENMKEIFETVNSQVHYVDRQVHRISFIIEKKLNKFKRDITFTLLFLLLLILALISLFVGVIVWLNQFIDLYIILLGLGFILLIIAFLIKALQ